MLFSKCILILNVLFVLSACTGKSDDLPGPYEKTIMEMKLRGHHVYTSKERSLYSTFYIPRNHYVFAYFKRDYRAKVGAVILDTYFLYPDGTGLTKDTANTAQNFIVPNKWVKVLIKPETTVTDIKTRYKNMLIRSRIKFEKININNMDGIEVHRSTKDREESVYAFTDYSGTFVYINCTDFSVVPNCRAWKTYREHEVEYQFFEKDMVKNIRDINKQVNKFFDSFNHVMNYKK